MYSKHSIHKIQYIVHVMLHACHTVQHTYMYHILHVQVEEREVTMVLTFWNRC